MVDKEVLAPGSQIIARYFSMEKTAKLLKEPGIWFSAFNVQDDHSEGSFFPLFLPPQSNIGIEHRTLLLNHQRISSFSLISCWTDFSGGESEKLWADYAQNEGACVITTVERLQNAFKNNYTDRPTPAVKVEYIPESELKIRAPKSYKPLPHIWNPDNPSQRCRIFPEAIKTDRYACEQEIRFVICSFIEVEGRLQKFHDLGTRSDSLPFEKILLRGSQAMKLQSSLKDTFRCRVEPSKMQHNASMYDQRQSR